MTRRCVWLCWGLAGVVAAWLLWMTLRPNDTVASELAPLTVSASEQGLPKRVLIDLIGNVAVFVPLGVTVALALGCGGWPVVRQAVLATVAGAALSLGIELAQTGLPSRVAAPGDWLLNTLGTAIGAVAGCWLSTEIERSGLTRKERKQSDDRLDN